MEAGDMRRRLEESRTGHLGTVGADAAPHVVPVCFVLEGNSIYFAVDSKPKRTRDLKRLRNIATNPRVTVLIDHYEEDWRRLWWVRVDGLARVVADEDEIEMAIALLQRRYAQYREARPDGPVVAISIERLSGWSAT
jgi:PPOX class probable F420-dependent enzyme